MDGTTYHRTFFGDNALQKTVVDQLTANLAAPNGIVHYVTGGRRSGKSSAIRSAIGNLVENGQFQAVSLAEAEAFWESDPALQTIRGALADQLNSAPDDDPGPINQQQIQYGNYTLLRDLSNPGHYVLYVIPEITLPRNVHAMKTILAAAADTHKPVSIVLDAFVRALPLIPGQQGQRQCLELGTHNDMLAALEQENPERMAIYRMEYNLDQIRDTLWNIYKGWDRDAFADYLFNKFNLDANTQEWLIIFRILEAKDKTPANDTLRRQYDDAFDHIISQQQYALRH